MKRGVLPALFLQDALSVGAMLHNGRYRIESVLGCGGFGVTYQAIHMHLKMPVAIKEFYPQDYLKRDKASSKVLIADHEKQVYEKGLQHFLNEGRILARLNHPNIVRVFDYFSENGTAYLVMELIDGVTLKDEMQGNGGSLDEKRVRAVFERLVNALGAAHAAGIFHLDIKPTNILIARDGRIILIDFGSARYRLRSSATQMFSREYAAPEIIAGGDIGPESDIFELGMVLHEMLTGELPPPASTRMQNDDWTPKGLEEPWSSLLAASLQLDQEKRPSDIRMLPDIWRTQTAAELATTIRIEPSPTQIHREVAQKRQAAAMVKPNLIPAFKIPKIGNALARRLVRVIWHMLGFLVGILIFALVLQALARVMPIAAGAVESKAREEISTIESGARGVESEAYKGSGVFLFNIGYYGKAADMLLKAIELNPNDADAYAKLGWVRLNQGRFGDASLDFNRALALDPNNKDANLGRQYLSRSGQNR